MKKFIMIFSAIVISFMAHAQSESKFGPYETNPFSSNWFVEAGAGVNMPFDNWFKDYDFGGLATYGSVGKWFVPCYGVRVGWLGLTTGNLDEPTTFKNSFNDNYFNYVHGDFIVNVSNLFGGYKERIVSFEPYVTAGGLFNKRNVILDDEDQTPTVQNGRALGVGAGLQVPIRLGKRVSLVPRVQGLLTNGRIYGGSGVTMLGTASIGLRISLGKTGWTRTADTHASYNARLYDFEVKNNELTTTNGDLTRENEYLKIENDKLIFEVNELKARIAEENKEQPAVYVESEYVAHFSIGSAELSEQSKDELKKFIEGMIVLNNGRDVVFSVCGSSDSKTGTEKRNRELREQRAEYVVNILKKEYNIENVQIMEGLVDINTPELSRAAIIVVK